MNIQEFKESLISKVQRLIEYLRSEPFDEIEMKLGDGPRGLDERLKNQKKYHYKNEDPFSLQNELRNASNCISTILLVSILKREEMMEKKNLFFVKNTYFS